MDTVGTVAALVISVGSIVGWIWLEIQAERRRPGWTASGRPRLRTAESYGTMWMRTSESYCGWGDDGRCGLGELSDVGRDDEGDDE